MLYVREQRGILEGTKINIKEQNKFVELIFLNKRNKSLGINKQNAIRLGTKINFKGNKNKHQGTKKIAELIF
jgi:hypothetical protein